MADTEKSVDYGFEIIKRYNFEPRAVLDVWGQFLTKGGDLNYERIVYLFEHAEPTKVHILLVPGHEPNFGGAEFTSKKYGTLKERVMNNELAKNLYGLLQDDPHYDVTITRNNESWYPEFENYFKYNWSAIMQWQNDSHREMKHLVSIGSTTALQIVATSAPVFHNTAPTNVAYRLYGITKWSNENNIDMVLHIHFNDDTKHKNGVPGKHSGFAIYVPAGQFGNSTTTKALANALFRRLKMNNVVSDLPGESSGIVDESQLIAIGANNTADAASMLIEYGYIYESQFIDPASRSLAVKKLAEQTYLGLKDFFQTPILY